MQGTVKGEEDEVDRRRGGKTTSENRQFAKSQGAVENRGKWRKLVVKSRVVSK